MTKNYIFDFGNVLANFHADDLTSPFLADSEEKKLIADIVFDRLYWDRLDDGTITDDEVKEGICGRLSPEHHEVACKVYDNWIQTISPVRGMTELVKDISKTGAGLYLLSNISRGFARDYPTVLWIKELLSLFDGMVFSGVIGLVKPDKAIFRHLLCEFDLRPEDCIFIDDSSVNILGAKEVGIDGYLFDGDAYKLRQYLGF